MIPDLVPDRDVLALRQALPGDMLDSRQGYCRFWFPYYLGREVTLEETDEILSKINGYGPRRFEETWASVERTTTAWWRSQL